MDWCGLDQEQTKPIAINDELEIWIKSSFEIRILVSFSGKISGAQLLWKNGTDSYIIGEAGTEKKKTGITFEVRKNHINNLEFWP